MQDRMSNKMSHSCQVKCQVECEINVRWECQMEYQIEHQIYISQKHKKYVYVILCHLECHNICQGIVRIYAMVIQGGDRLGNELSLPCPCRDGLAFTVCMFGTFHVQLAWLKLTYQQVTGRSTKFLEAFFGGSISVASSCLL